MRDPLDISGLSASHQRILSQGVRGAEDDPNAPADPTTPADPGTPADPPADPPVDPAADPATADPAAPADAPADPPAIDVPELPGDPAAENPLEAVDEVALRAAFDQFEALIAEHRTTAGPGQIDALELARAHQSAISAEIQRRIDVATATAARLEALDTGAPALPDAVPVPALASARAVVAGRDRQAPAAQASPETRPARPRAALVAAAGANVVGVGTEIDLATLGEAIDSVKSGDSGKARLASVQGFDEIGADQFPEALSRSNTWERNNELIREAQADFMALRAGQRPAHTATVCEPLDIIREIPDSFNATEVVSPELPSRPAGRLGYQHSLSIDLTDVLAGVQLWTEADQAAVDPTDPTTWKPCADVECPEPVSVIAQAVVACLKFDITTEMSNPETVRNYMNALDALRARTKEGRILQRLDELSSRYTFVGDYGALPALIQAINTAVSQAIFANRQDDPQYTLFVDPLVTSLLRIDRANKGYVDEDVDPGDAIDETLQYMLNNVAGVSRVVQTLDAATGGEPGLPPATINPPGAAAITLPKTNGLHRIRLIDPRTFIYAETGKMDTGVQRSPELMLQNKAQLFGEEFFFLDRTGPWANFSIDIDLCSDGARAGLVDPAGCASS